MRIMQNNNFIKPLKFGNIRQNVFVKNVNPLTRRPVQNININLWAKFNAETFDGINVLGYLEELLIPLTGGEATFTLYSVSNDSLWNENFIAQKTILIPSKRFTTNFSEIETGQLDGESTLAITLQIKMQNKVFNKKIYLNHLGIFDSLFRLKQEVEFLDLTKKDE